MKKFFALILALVLAFSLSSVAFAADVTVTIDGRDAEIDDVPNAGEDWTKTGDVFISLGAGDPAKIYFVEIIWQDLTFNYDKTAAVWNPQNHAYEDTGAVSGWGGKTSATITVKNHSNDTVTAAAAFADSAKSVTEKGVTATITGTDGEIATAVGTAVESAPNTVYTVTVSGAPAADFVAGRIGIVTVKISHVAPATPATP